MENRIEQLIELVGQYLPRFSRGKVRDVFVLPKNPLLPGSDLLLVIASDRISIFDFVLNAHVQGKGHILTAMNIFWRKVLGDLFSHDLVAYGYQIDDYLPRALRGGLELRKRAVVVRRLRMFPVEGVVRGNLTGSGWDAYLATNPHMVCGHVLSDGLVNGSLLPQPIFTPTTKAEVGHDEHLTAESVQEQYGDCLEVACLNIFSFAKILAASQGIIIADTKLELGSDGDKLVLGDEVLTPDSSRFWERDDWEQALREGRVPTPYDKQMVREFGKNLGIHKKDPANPDDVAWVNAQVIDPDILGATAETYRRIFRRLTGQSLEEFQHDVMQVTR